MSSRNLDSIKNKVKIKTSKLYSKLLQKSNIKIPDVTSNNVSLNTGFFSILFTLIWNGIILYYLHNLEDTSCKCIRDWRHNFMKLIAYINITLSIIPLLTINIKFNKSFLLSLGIIIIILNTLYIYAFYTYIGILNKSKCSCAIINNPKINNLLYYRRDTILLFYILGILTIITGINISFSININSEKFKYII